MGPVGDDVDMGRILKSLRCGVAGRERKKRPVMARHAPDLVHQTNKREHALPLSVSDDAGDVLQKVIGRDGIKKIVVKGEWLTDKVSLD